MRTEIIIDHDAGNSATVTEMYEACIGLVVSFEIRDNTGYPDKNVCVLRIDEDGDVVVCELDDKGEPREGETWAIPQEAIYRVHIGLGSFS